tara:strand:+ start:598 stop:864 length:267 start_codon:yes stop_codon:yes gene_type:complete
MSEEKNKVLIIGGIGEKPFLTPMLTKIAYNVIESTKQEENENLTKTYISEEKNIYDFNKCFEEINPTIEDKNKEPYYRKFEKKKKFKK